MIHRHEIRVRYGETDMMGVVHHSVYPLYFEEARTELMRALGYRYAELEAEGYLLPLVNIGIRFIKGAVYDNALILTARLTEVSKVQLVIEYEVFRKEDGERLATGHTHHACTSKDLRVRRMPAEVYDAFVAAREAGTGSPGKIRGGGPV